MNASAAARPIPPKSGDQTVIMMDGKMPNIWIVIGSVMFIFICALLAICFNNVTDSIKAIGIVAQVAAQDAKSSISEIKNDVKGIRETQDKMHDQQTDLKVTLAGVSETIKSIDARTTINTNNIDSLQHKNTEHY